MSPSSLQQEADAAPATEVLPLPELPESQTGTSTASARHYKASVSNAAGYLCHISVECEFDVPPAVIFEVFAHPDNAGAFRDIKDVGYRKVVVSEPGFKRVEVEQCGELRVMWVRRVFRTYLDVTEDSRDPECLKTDFSLLRSDILARFHGAWTLRPRRDAATGAVVGCHATLEQDVLPRGVPSFFARLPVLGGLLRQVSLHTIKRLMEDILGIVAKYKAAGGRLSVGEVLVQVAAQRGHQTDTAQDRAGHLPPVPGYNGAAGDSSRASAVTSFAVDDFTESEDSSETSPRAARRGDGSSGGGGGGGGGGGSQQRRAPRASGSGGGGGGMRSNGGGAQQGVDASAAGGGAPSSSGGGGKAEAGAGAGGAADPAAAAAGSAGGAADASHGSRSSSNSNGSRVALDVGLMLDVTEHGGVHMVMVRKEDLQQ